MAYLIRMSNLPAFDSSPSKCDTVKWYRERVDELYKNDIIKAAKMLQASMDDSSKGIDEEWNVRAVMAGDGTRSSCGVFLESEKLYASSSMNGGPESFHEIDGESLRVCDQGAEVLRWPCVPVTKNAKLRVGRTQGPVADMQNMTTAQKKLKVVQVVRRWCYSNNGFAVVIGGPRSRVENSKVAMYLRPSTSLRVYQAVPGQCLEGSIINGAASIGGIEAAISWDKVLFENTKMRISATGLRVVGNLLHQCNKLVDFKLESRRICKKDLAAYKENPFFWLSESAKGFWIIRIVQIGIVDHCITVDTEQALIYDCVEEHPIALTEETLRLCGGGDANCVKVAEIRELREQRRKCCKKPRLNK